MPVSPQQARQLAARLAAVTPSTPTTLASPPPAAVAADYKGSAKDKAPRPPTAFIIYRQEWHPKSCDGWHLKVVKEKPESPQQ